MRNHRIMIGNVVDLPGFFDGIDWESPGLYSEKKLLNVLAMTCAALNPLFQQVRSYLRPHFLLLYGGFSYQWRKILEMLLKLIKLYDLMGH